MKTSDLQTKTHEELRSLLVVLSKESFNLKMQKATNQLTSTHQIRIVKKNIARVLFVIGEKERVNYV
ncbi:MAG: 50S ribosomal protein L29 [Methylovulum sp.]|jgi:large subunit ribosomal protein L29|nr:50S ribosomal protein L29 [Methylovulum sp.]TSA40583.1 MAG: 50S ribosomal protein L29 [Methylococcaceae bacterium]